MSLLSGDLHAADGSITASLATMRSEVTPEFRTQQLALEAQLALQRGYLRKGQTLVERMFAGRDLSRTTLADREGHRTAYEIYRRLDQTALALPHLAALKRLDDDATTLARSNSLPQYSHSRPFFFALVDAFSALGCG